MNRFRRFLYLGLLVLSNHWNHPSHAGIPPDYPPPLNIGLTEPVGPSVDVEALAGPKTEPVDSGRYSDILHVSSSEGSDATGVGSATSRYQSLTFAVSQIPSTAGIDLFALFVSSGFYQSTSPIEVPERTHLYGGFATGSWTRNLEVNPTILDGGGGDFPTILVASNDTLFDGFTIQNGHRDSPQFEDGGGGIHLIRNASGSITNNTFRYNSANNGGAVFCDNDSIAYVTNNLFYENEAPFGAAVYSGFRTETLIAGNIVRNNGGGSAVMNSGNNKLSVLRNVLKGNAGSGLACSCREGHIFENLIIANRSNGLNLSSGEALASENSIQSNGGAGINCGQGSHVSLSRNLSADNQGPGIVGAFNSSTDLSNNVISGNSAIGVFAWSGVIRNNLVINNTSSFDAGGILLSAGTISHNLVASNHTKEQGGGIHTRFVDSVTVTTNLVAFNTSEWQGGGIFCYESNLLNNIVFRNEAPSGAGMFCQSNDVWALNNLVLENSALTSAGGAFFGYNTDATAVNNIFYNNTANGLPSQIVVESLNLSLHHSLVQGGFDGEAIIDGDPRLAEELLAGEGTGASYSPDDAQSTITVSDPNLLPGSLEGRFIQIGNRGTAVVSNTTNEIVVWGNMVDSVSGETIVPWRLPDFRLREDSSCIGAGLSPDVLADVPLEDFDGDTRTGITSDIGPDEFNSAYSLPTALPTSTPTVTSTPTDTPTLTFTSTPTQTLTSAFSPTPTEEPFSEYDLYPVGGDGLIDARDLLEFIATHGESPKAVLDYARIWKGSE